LKYSFYLTVAVSYDSGLSVKKEVEKAAKSQKKQPKVRKSQRKVDVSLTFPNFWSLFLTISDFLFYRAGLVTLTYVTHCSSDAYCPCDGHCSCDCITQVSPYDSCDLLFL
jgi:hypothetical protein